MSVCVWCYKQSGNDWNLLVRWLEVSRKHYVILYKVVECPDILVPIEVLEPIYRHWEMTRYKYKYCVISSPVRIALTSNWNKLNRESQGLDCWKEWSNLLRLGHAMEMIVTLVLISPIEEHSKARYHCELGEANTKLGMKFIHQPTSNVLWKWIIY